MHLHEPVYAARVNRHVTERIVPAATSLAIALDVDA